MVKKEYWVIAINKNGKEEATRFLTRGAAEKYKNNFKKAYIKEYEMGVKNK